MMRSSARSLLRQDVLAVIYWVLKVGRPGSVSAARNSAAISSGSITGASAEVALSSLPLLTIFSVSFSGPLVARDVLSLAKALALLGMRLSLLSSLLLLLAASGSSAQPANNSSAAIVRR
jgi:hypothetical protein